MTGVSQNTQTEILLQQNKLYWFTLNNISCTNCPWTPHQKPPTVPEHFVSIWTLNISQKSIIQSERCSITCCRAGRRCRAPPGSTAPPRLSDPWCSGKAGGPCGPASGGPGYRPTSGPKRKECYIITQGYYINTQLLLSPQTHLSRDPSGGDRPPQVFLLHKSVTPETTAVTRVLSPQDQDTYQPFTETQFRSCSLN